MDSIIRFFEEYAGQVPLELFVFVGEFLEELISPIPAFVVLIPAGAAAAVQNVDPWYLAVLALLGAAGRLLGAIILYLLADKFEDRILGNNRRFFGMTHVQIEALGARLGKSKRNWLVLFLMNAIPIVPAALISLTCGFLKVHLRTFMTATFWGTSVNSLIYLGIGYAGLRATSTLQGLETASEIVLVLCLIAIAVWIGYRIRRSRSKRSKK